jgi:hypothetical protein
VFAYQRPTPALWLTFHAIRVLRFWPQASATVVRYSIRRSDEQPFYHPVVRFQTADGCQVLTISNSGWWTRRWPIGAVLPVRYNSANPRWIEVISVSNLWGFALPLVVFGFLAFVAVMLLGLPKLGLHGVFP